MVSDTINVILPLLLERWRTSTTRTTQVTFSPMRRRRVYLYSCSPCKSCILVGSNWRPGIFIRKVVGNVGGAYSIGVPSCNVGSSVASMKRCTASFVTSNVGGEEV